MNIITYINNMSITRINMKGAIKLYKWYINPMKPVLIASFDMSVSFIIKCSIRDPQISHVALLYTISFNYVNSIDDETLCIL